MRNAALVGTSQLANIPAAGTLASAAVAASTATLTLTEGGAQSTAVGTRER